MTLKEQIEADLGLPVGEPTAHVRSVTGEPYVVLNLTGDATDEEMTAAFRNAVRGYWLAIPRSGSGYRLYWRLEPEFKKRPALNLTEVRCRLLISNKPVLEEAAWKAAAC